MRQRVRYKLFLSIFAAGLSFQVCAAQRYVTNDLFIYLHSGPGKNYRIIGTVNAGESVNEIAYDKASNYAHIKLPNSDKDGWIKADQLTNTPSLNHRLAAANKDKEQAVEQLKALQQNTRKNTTEKKALIDQLQSQLSDEKKRTSKLSERLANLVATNKKLTAKLGNIEQDVQMQWLIKGGIVAGAGLLIGLIIPYLPRRRKHNSDRWM